MSVRMDATLYSEVARLERGNYLTFECRLLSQVGRDVTRQFIGAFYPHWRALYVEEVRSIIGSMGHRELRHFPTYPFDVYLKSSGHTGTDRNITTSTIANNDTNSSSSSSSTRHRLYGGTSDLASVDEALMYRCDDFYVGNVLILGTPQNQRDDDVKRFCIVSVDASKLQSCTVPTGICGRGRGGSEEGANKKLCSSFGTLAARRSATCCARSHTHAAAADARTGGRTIERSAHDTCVSDRCTEHEHHVVPVGARLVSPTPVSSSVSPCVVVCSDVLEIIHALRDAYIAYVGGGVPEVGIKAMGRPFRRVASDGRRWMTLARMCTLVANSRAFDSVTEALPTNRVSTHEENRRGWMLSNRHATVESVARVLYDAFPHNESGLVLGEGGGTATVAAAAACNADVDVECGVDYDVFMDCVRGQMNRTRQSAVQRVFDHMDFDKDGYIAIHDIQAYFNAQEHPLVTVDGNFAADKLLGAFLSMWDYNETRHGHVPLTEFMDYYNGLSYTIERDDVFLGILQSTWKLPWWSK